jgi:hypothetical protein
MNVIINGERYIKAPPEPKGKGLAEALEVRFDYEDADQVSVREYLYTLLNKVWHEQECFDGKRPFGNSDWEWNLLNPLALAGFIDLGKNDGDQHEPSYYPSKEQLRAAHAYVSDLIAYAMFGEAEQ